MHILIPTPTNTSMQISFILTTTPMKVNTDPMSMDLLSMTGKRTIMFVKADRRNCG
jgi:hypothetical protein